MMRLFKGFLMLVLCMGLMVSCFEGPPGPQGEPGPKGDPGEVGEPGDAGDGDLVPVGTFDFLVSWGHETGEVACDDPILTKGEMASLPEPKEFEEIMVRVDNTETDVNEAYLNSPVVVKCDNGDWNELGEIQELAFDAGMNHLVFYKDKRASETEDKVVPQSPKNLHMEGTSTTEYVSGRFYANIPDTGGKENGERYSLNKSCPDVGTAPPEIKGNWTAVKVVDKLTTYKDSEPVGSTDENPNPSTKTVMTKVCVNLDAHPGATKCYVNAMDSDGMSNMSVNLYNDEGLVATPVVEKDNLPGDSGTNQKQYLFGGGAAGDFDEVENLCALFDQGVKQES